MSVLEEKFKEAYYEIAWYNGYVEWLRDLVDRMKESDDLFYGCPLPAEEWLTDKHALWMLLVGMFGDWGTSIRGGWINNKKAAIAFLNEVLGSEEEVAEI